MPDDPVEEVQFEGVKVRIGNRQWVMPSLSVGQARKLWPEILNLNKGVTNENVAEKMGVAIPIIHAALSRNYPQLTVDQVEDMVSISQLGQLLLIVSGQSGLKPGEKEPDVEKVPAAPVVH